MAQAALGRDRRCRAARPGDRARAPRRDRDRRAARPRHRGADRRPGRCADARGADDIVAWALDAAPTGAAAVELAATCARAAAAGRPVCLLAPPPRGSGRAAIERAAALAYLRAHGAALGHDVDAWLEAVVLLVRFGLPTGPRAAVIAPAGSWLEAQAPLLVADAEAAGRAPAGDRPAHDPDEPTDVVLYDPALGAPPRDHAGPARPGRRARRARRRSGDRCTARAPRSARSRCSAAPRERIAVGPRPRAAGRVGRARDRRRAAATASSPSSRDGDARRRSRDQGAARPRTASRSRARPSRRRRPRRSSSRAARATRSRSSRGATICRPSPRAARSSAASERRARAPRVHRGARPPPASRPPRAPP